MFSLIDYCKNNAGTILTTNPEDIKFSFSKEVSVFFGKPNLSEKEISNRNRRKIILEKGLDWLFEKASVYQPLFYSVLKDKKCALYYFARPISSPWNGGFFYYDSLCVLGDGVSFALDASLVDNLMEEEDALFTNSVWRNLFCSIPREIVLTYFWRASGFDRILNESFQSNTMADFPAIHKSEDVLTLVSSPLEKKQLLQSIDKIRQQEIKVKGESNFAVFMDTLDVLNPVNDRDILIFERNTTVPKLYCIPKMDFGNIQLLSNPVTAIDDYVSTLLHSHQKINFTKWL